MQFAVVGNDQSSLRCVAAFAVPAGNGFLEQSLDRQRVDVGFPDRAFHVDVVNHVLRIGQVPRDRGDADRHVLRRDRSHVALRVDQVMSDQQLVRFLVDHSPRRRAADAFGVNRHRLLKIRIDGEQFVFAAARHVRCVVHHPQFAGPRHDRSDAAFVVPVFVVSTVLAVDAVGRQMRIDAADVNVRASGFGRSDGDLLVVILRWFLFLRIVRNQVRLCHL